MSDWLMTTYFQAAGEYYFSAAGTQRHVISSSYSQHPYTAAWYNDRADYQAPWILLSGSFDAGNGRVLYSLCVIEGQRERVLLPCKCLSLLSKLQSECILLCLADAAPLLLLLLLLFLSFLTISRDLANMMRIKAI
jgi:hypothetical protein